MNEGLSYLKQIKLTQLSLYEEKDPEQFNALGVQMRSDRSN